MDNYHVAIISKGRPQNVESMQALVGYVTWYVGLGEAPFYKAQGAKLVVEAGGLVEARNHALKDAFSREKICVQLSDDLVKLERAVTKKETIPLTFKQALKVMENAMWAKGAYLAGIAPTNNPFFYNPQIPIHDRHFIIGDMIMIKPTHLQFDSDMRLKEDYDYTMQHIAEYGKVARCDSILAEFKHYNNKGGAVQNYQVRATHD